MIDAYPLDWPVGYDRTTPHARKQASFGSVRQSSYGCGRKQLTIAEALKRLTAELDKFTRPGRTYRTRDLVVSTDVPVRKGDGLPYSSAREPDDPGVAVYYVLDDSPVVMCCDKWDRVADNIAAIAASIGALRGLDRWGMSQADRAFTGFAALPAPGETQAQTCWDVLELKPTTDRTVVDKRFKELCKKHHPNAGGERAMWDVVQDAYEQAIAQCQD